ncbi:MAG: VWA domain-containing protein, partial [Planctomycetota bacterium]
ENIAAINNGMEVVDSQRVVLASDGTLTGVRFELEAEVTGKRQLALRVIPPGEDQNRDDNESSARYEVVTEKLKVLTIAGGPMREYRFVGNMLYRDKSIERDTWLQTGAPGISQDADKLLSDFPSTAEELFEYDAIVAFDPDWSQLSTEQIDLMDRWLTRQAGGLILVSGPVYLPQWSRNRTDTKLATVRGFFPVVLATRASLIDGGRQGGDTAWPLRFTPEATKSEFFWIEKTPAESFETWGKFSGVYDYVGVKDAKPGAKVYANFSDDTTAIDDKLPIYLASQFYGSGRVFFQGSGEMWRLRGVNDSYFETYYTKLIRWISQGRLLRDSNRGILLVDRDRAMVGDTITVRAVLNDAQFRPLQVPSVDAILQGPGGSVQTITLEPVPGESGNGSYSGRFLVRAAGTYDLRLTLGDALNEEELTQSVSVRLPMIELERPRRDDQTLSMIAAKTGGEYLKIDEQNASPPAPAGTATDNSQTPATLSNLPQKISPQPQTTLLPGTPDLDFARRHNALLMWLIATCLTYEWVVRRLHRLA